jgi:hypothetical protein
VCREVRLVLLGTCLLSKIRDCGKKRPVHIEYESGWPLEPVSDRRGGG